MNATCYYGAENIQGLVPRALPKLVKNPIYRSQHRAAVKASSSEGKLQQRTMGFAKTPLNPPDKYLKKAVQPKNAITAGFKYPDDRKPPVPTHLTEHKPNFSQKNFIKENAVDIIKSAAKKPVPKYVDTPTGHKNDLIPSGMFPQYSKKSNYGKVPAYITERKRAEEEAQREYDAYIKERMQQGSLKRLPEDERETILEGLKTNWSILQHQYQGLSVVIDTLPKKSRKEKLESEMKQLERDIELLERHPVIYIQ